MRIDQPGKNHPAIGLYHRGTRRLQLCTHTSNMPLFYNQIAGIIPIRQAGVTDNQFHENYLPD
jgi:hypothetical protein